ncbi:hypothetical protein [Bdellovibrio sp. HCB209]|uniref:hypothetical protein n=1 Tax=Bdellovibrio sp. HCB209 TaxID=3394354 RepID=UPI0039B5F714
MRFVFFKDDRAAVYLGAATQRQDKTDSSQDALYDKNLVMPLIGARYQIWNSLHIFAEARTEDRSRIGLFAGNMWQYELVSLNAFTEFYAEGVILPSYNNDPVSTGWIKQGFRFNLSQAWKFDPYIELYGRRSPTPDLGRDTDQARAGARLIVAGEKFSASLLAYEAFVSGEKSHNEAMLVFGGAF